jgi:hypothetical protein
VTERPVWTPRELLDHAGVPNAARDRVMFELVAAKYVAAVEQAQRLNGGQPIRIEVARLKQILTDRESGAGVQEVPADDREAFLVSIADPAEILASLERDRLRRMGPHRN